MKKFLSFLSAVFMLSASARAANVVNDTFTGTNETILTSHTGELGATWSSDSGGDNNAKITSNRIYYGGSSFCIYRASGTSTSGNIDVSAIVHCFDNTGIVEFGGRVSSPGGTYTAYHAHLQSGSVSIGKDPGNITFQSASFTFVAGQDYTIRLSITDAKKRLYVNGVELASTTDNSVTGASGQQVSIVFSGTVTTSTGFHIDSFTAGPVYNPGTTSSSATGTTTVTASSTAATGDTGTYTAQYQRAADVSGSPGSFSDVGSAQSGITLGVAPSNLSDTGLTASTTYWYRVKATYSSDGTILYTNGVSVTTNAGSGLAGGTTSASATGSTTATVSNTAATGGTAPYTYQYQRAPDASGSPGTFANVGSAQSGLGTGVAPSNLSDTGLTASTKYWYRVGVTDSAAGSVNTTAVSITTPARSAATFYVSATGSDSNSGTSSGSPWQTVSKVNTNGFVAGDTVLFNGGDSFAGGLIVAPASAPTATSRITITSYGTGTATITQSGSTQAIKLTNSPYTTIKGLNILGPGVTVTGTYPARTSSSTSTGEAIHIEYNTTATYQAGIVVDSVTVSGTKYGINCGGTNSAATAGFDGLRISNCTIHDLMDVGIAVWGDYSNTSQLRINRYVQIVDCNVYNIRGVTSQANGTGFPLILFCAIDSSIVGCVTHTCGEAQETSTHNGVCGPIFAHATRCVMRACESYDMFSPQRVDGNGFDFDEDCTNCVIEYCYSHDTDGSSMLLWNENGGSNSSTGSIIRYCILANGNRYYNSNLGAGLSTTPFAGTNTLVHNCTFYNDYAGPSSVTALVNIRSGSQASFYNNIFSVGTGMTFGDAGSSATLVGNVYDVRAGSSFSITASGSTYTTLAALRTASFETLNSVTYGAAASPAFTAGGTYPVIMPSSPVASLRAYDITNGSAAQGVGVDLFRLSITPPIYDWHGNRAYQGETGTLSGFDAGPVRTNSTVPSSAGTRAFSF